jgi:hypothetical protein
MADSVLLHATKNLGTMRSYVPFDDPLFPEQLRNDESFVGKEIVGVYAPPTNQPMDRMVFSRDDVSWWGPNHWQSLRYVDMVSVVIDEADKHHASSLTIRTVDGRDIQILVSGGTGRFRDMYGITSFLIWMTNHARKSDSRSSTKSDPVK